MNNGSTMSSTWPIVRLGDVLQLQRRWLKLDPLEEYVEIGVRSYGRGIFHKQPVSGASLGDKRVLRICPGDLVFMNVFAWEGAVAVAGPTEEGTIGSHRFATFTPINNACHPPFLQLYFQTEAGRELLGRVSPGSAGRNRTMNLAMFTEQQIPLPSLDEQRRIVAQIEDLVARTSAAMEMRCEADEERHALLRSTMRTIFGVDLSPDWPVLADFVEDIENGWSPACLQRRVENGEWGVLKVGAVSFGYFDPREHKALPPTLVPQPQYEIRAGDFLMSRANTVALVGACAVVKTTPPRLMLCDKIFRFNFRDASKVNLSYWDYVMKSPPVRGQIERAASGTSSTMKNISKPKILGLRVPRLGESEQQRIVHYLDGISRGLALLERLHGGAAELDALLPAILNKAFKGEL